MSCARSIAPWDRIRPSCSPMGSRRSHASTMHCRRSRSPSANVSEHPATSAPSRRSRSSRTDSTSPARRRIAAPIWPRTSADASTWPDRLCRLSTLSSQMRSMPARSPPPRRLSSKTACANCPRGSVRRSAPTSRRAWSTTHPRSVSRTCARSSASSWAISTRTAQSRMTRPTALRTTCPCAPRPTATGSCVDCSTPSPAALSTDC